VTVAATDWKSSRVTLSFRREEPGMMPGFTDHHNVFFYFQKYENVLKRC